MLALVNGVGVAADAGPRRVLPLQRDAASLVVEAAAGDVEGAAVDVGRVAEGPRPADAGDGDEELALRLQPAQVQLVDVLAAQQRPRRRIVVLPRPGRHAGIPLPQPHGTRVHHLARRGGDDLELPGVGEVVRPELLEPGAQVGELAARAGQIPDLVDLDGARDGPQLVVEEGHPLAVSERDAIVPAIGQGFGHLEVGVVGVVDAAAAADARAAERDDGAGHPLRLPRRLVAGIVGAGDAIEARLVELALAREVACLSAVLGAEPRPILICLPVRPSRLLALLPVGHSLEVRAARQLVDLAQHLLGVRRRNDHPAARQHEELLDALIGRHVDRELPLLLGRQRAVLRREAEGSEPQGRSQRDPAVSTHGGRSATLSRTAHNPGTPPYSALGLPVGSTGLRMMTLRGAMAATRSGRS